MKPISMTEISKALPVSGLTEVLRQRDNWLPY